MLRASEIRELETCGFVKMGGGILRKKRSLVKLARPANQGYNRNRGLF